MPEKLTITTCESSITVTDGVVTRTATMATTTGAKRLAASFEELPELGRRWLTATQRPRPSTRLMPVSIRRIGRTVTIYADTGAPLRTCLCPSIQDAVTLELKLAGDLDFAVWWVLGDRRQASTNKSGKPG